MPSPSPLTEGEGVKESARRFHNRTEQFPLPFGERVRVRGKLQRLDTFQRRREVIPAGHRFGEAQHRVAFTVGIAKHAQQLLLDVIQARAVGAEIEAMGAAGVPYGRL